MSSGKEIKKHNKRHLKLQKYEVINTDLISEFRKSDRFRIYFVLISQLLSSYLLNKKFIKYCYIR